MAQLIDISPVVTEATPTWPGDAPFQLDAHWSHEAGDTVSVGTITSTTHLGSHIDGPSHIIPGAPSVYETPLDACIGESLVLDVSALVDRTRSPHGQVSVEAVRELAHTHTRAPLGRLLLRHYEAPQTEWDPELPGISPALMRWFAGQGGQLMGIDLASFDPAEDPHLECHKTGIASGVVLLEGLDLHAAPVGLAELIALPLAWRDADASPVRAVLRVATPPRYPHNDFEGEL